MASSFRDAAKALEDMATADGKAMADALAKAIRLLQARVDLVLAGEPGGWSYRNLGVLTAEMEAALQQSGMYDVAAKFGDAAKAYAKRIDGASKLFTFGESHANMLASAVKARYDGWELTVQQNTLDWIRQRLVVQTVDAVAPGRLAEELASQLGDLQPYARTYIETGLHQQIRDTWAVAGDAMGAVDYEYAGPPTIDTSHEFCVEHYGEVKSLEEWRALDNGSDLPVVWSCGGWGCRHTLEPVPPGSEGL